MLNGVIAQHTLGVSISDSLAKIPIVQSCSFFYGEENTFARPAEILRLSRRLRMTLLGVNIKHTKELSC